jgi:hypothetical protein
MAYATELAETERIEDARLVIERRREALQLTKAASPATAVVAALCYGEAVPLVPGRRPYRPFPE